MSLAPTDITLADTDTWEQIADFTADGEQPLGVRIEHTGNVANAARIIVDPLHGTFEAAPTTEDGAPLAAYASKEWVSRTDSTGAGSIKRIWAKSGGLATLNVDPSAA